jgi:hypothetical protein
MIKQKITYPLPSHRPPLLPLSAQIEDLRALLKLLDEHGIVTKNTRLTRYVDFLLHIESTTNVQAELFFKNVYDERFLSDMDWYLYVLREVHELHWITKGLRKHFPKGCTEKLREIVSGSDFAALDKNSQYRNIQFELRIASYFCQFKYEVDLSTSTDVIAQSRRSTFYIECKRVTNHSQLRKRISEATKQLIQRVPNNESKPRCYGIVVIDVTKVAFDHNGLTFGITPDHSKDIIQKKLVEISESIDDQWLFGDNDCILLYWLQIHIPSVSYTPPIQMTRFSSYLHPRVGMDKDAYRAFIDFDTVFRMASTMPDNRQFPRKKLQQRRSLQLPKGTKCSLNSQLLEYYLSGKELGDQSDDEIIGSLEMNEKMYEFSMWDFRLLASNISEIVRQQYSENAQYAQLALVIALYIQRFPYEEKTSIWENLIKKISKFAQHVRDFRIDKL